MNSFKETWCGLKWWFEEKFFTFKMKHEKRQIKGTSITILDKRVSFWKPFLLIAPALTIVLLFTIVPLVLTAQSAFLAPSDPRDPVGTESFSTAFFDNLLANDAFGVSVRNSVFYAFLALPITITLAIVISASITFVINKLARGFWQTIFFLPYVTNAIAISLSFVYLFQQNGIINDLLGTTTSWLNSNEFDSYNPLIVILTQGVWNGLAFNVLLFTTAMLSVNPVLYKSASIDAAGSFKQFFTITLPSINKTTNLLITLGIIGGIKVFPIALFNNNPTLAQNNGGGTIMTYIFGQVNSGNLGSAAAASLVMFALGVAFSILLRGFYNYLLKFIAYRKEQHVYSKVETWKILRKI